MSGTVRLDDVGECVEATLRRLGPRLVIAAPLAIGKPNLLLNEFYRRAARDPSLSLTILTALSLNRPAGRSELERRFLEPFAARVFGDYPDLDYVRAAHAGRLPANVTVREFYLQAGAWLGVESVQQNYVSVNYTHVVRDALALGVNVLAQQVATRNSAGRDEYSLSSNPDLTLDLLALLDGARAAGRDFVYIGCVNRRMPFMLGGAVIDEERFDLLLDHPRYDYDPYCPPNLPIRDVEHAIGVNAAALVRDGGTLQLGIGELGDACVYALQLRQQRNAAFRRALDGLGVSARHGAEIAALGGLAPLERGLYACTEMFVDGFLDLYRSGILSRRVYPHATLQRLLDAGEISERPDVETLVALARAGVAELDAAGFQALAAAGLFAAGTRFAPPAAIVAPDGTRLAARLDLAEARAALAERCLSRRLDGGRVLHAGFFLGPRGFYGALRELAEADRAAFDMTRISYTNELYGTDYALKVAQRRHARFINTTMMVTGLGAAVSDGLASGQVVSGVGGQYNFVAMAHALPEAHSVLLVRATRTKDGRTSSNLVWNYGHETIPRHLRDVIVSEYGVAALRGHTDRDCVAALIAIADSRFQPALLADAQRAGKIERGYRIPDAQRQNLPAAIAAALAPLRAEGLFSEFPFGTDFTAEEIVLAKALEHLKAASATLAGRAGALARAATTRMDDEALRPYLERLGLASPAGWHERLYARLVAGAVAAVLGAT
ncbi:MAG TPA: acetyl-CoA hydrolase/transferase C-terminal domain-containing protein [Steroidobacteraceae bacterium]|nr:acetyl-CoA hydrolase/transferase C-terminal domain-containing protein [Steroidobacteraceae bacterium]